MSHTQPEQLPFASICAILEECGYRQGEIRNLTRHYVRRVLQHRRDPEGKLVFPRKTPAKGQSYTERIRVLLRKRGYPEHLIEERVQEALDRQKKSEQKKVKEPLPERAARKRQEGKPKPPRPRK